MIRHLPRTLGCMALSGLIVYLVVRIMVYHYQDPFAAQARVEALALGACVAWFVILVASILRLMIREALASTRIEERKSLISASKGYWVGENRWGELRQPTYARRSDARRREFIYVETLPVLETLEEMVR